jgi:apolipoprotein N-acyltransferase
VAEVELRSGVTPAMRIGAWFDLLNFALVLGLIAFLTITSKKRRRR